MFTATQIKAKIRSGENSGVEFKEARISGDKVTAPERNKLSDEIAAFANQSGGLIVFGIEDGTRRAVGIPQTDTAALIRYISEICYDSIEPAVVNFFVSDVAVADEYGEVKTLVYVQVEKSLWLHKSGNGYFYRHGDAKREMSPEHLLRVGQSRSQLLVVAFDEQGVPNTSQNSMRKDLYMRFVSEDEPSRLRQRRLLATRGNSLLASVAGILMCSTSPDEHIFNCFIQAVVYKGKIKDANYQIDAKDFRGPLDEQVIGAYSFVRRHNQVSANKNIGRVERSQYSMRAVFEALVNSVVHRDYSVSGSRIRLFMFADRIEISSPGLLANTLTVADLADNQFTRNELLSRLMSELTVAGDIGQTVERRYFLERRGEGVGIILRESERLSGRKPEYAQSGGELKLTIHAAGSLQDAI